MKASSPGASCATWSVRRTGAFAALVAYEYRVLRPGFDPFAALPANVTVAERLEAEVQRNCADNPRSLAAAWVCGMATREPAATR